MYKCESLGLQEVIIRCVLKRDCCMKRWHFTQEDFQNVRFLVWQFFEILIFCVYGLQLGNARLALYEEILVSIFFSVECIFILGGEILYIRGFEELQSQRQLKFKLSDIIQNIIGIIYFSIQFSQVEESVSDIIGLALFCSDCFCNTCELGNKEEEDQKCKNNDDSKLFYFFIVLGAILAIILTLYRQFSSEELNNFRSESTYMNALLWAQICIAGFSLFLFIWSSIETNQNQNLDIQRSCSRNILLSFYGFNLGLFSYSIPFVILGLAIVSCFICKWKKNQEIIKIKERRVETYEL